MNRCEAYFQRLKKACGYHMAVLPMLMVLALLSAACEENVSVVSGTDLPFTMFGVFSPQLDTQTVLVFTIDPSLEPLKPQPLSATVQSTDLLSGTVRTWKDSLILSEDGQYSHMFWSAFLAPFGHAYRLTVTDPTDNSSSVEVTVPPFAEIIVPPQSNSAPSTLNVLVQGDVPNLIRVEVTYTYLYLASGGIQKEEFLVSYEGKADRIAGGWNLPIRVLVDQRIFTEDLKTRQNIDEGIGVKVIKIRLRLIAANADWNPPGGVFDADVLVQPGLFSNVQNGFGFVGAGYRLENTWIPLDTVISSKR